MKKTTDQLIQMDFSEEMKNSFRDYALSVIIARALPDVRDGFKTGSEKNPVFHGRAWTGSCQAP